MDYQKSLRNLNKRINKRFDKKKLVLLTVQNIFRQGYFKII